MQTKIEDFKIRFFISQKQRKKSDLFLLFENCINDQKWENYYLFPAWLTPKECWIILEYCSEKLMKFIGFWSIKRITQHIQEKIKHHNTSNVKTHPEKYSRGEWGNYSDFSSFLAFVVLFAGAFFAGASTVGNSPTSLV